MNLQTYGLLVRCLFHFCPFTAVHSHLNGRQLFFSSLAVLLGVWLQCTPFKLLPQYLSVARFWGFGTVNVPGDVVLADSE